MSHPMMPLAIDPTERRAEAPAATRPGLRRAGRPILLAGLGCAGIVGLSVIANTMMAGLAGPPPIKKSLVSRAAADMPDLRDGVPALVSSPSMPPAPAPRDVGAVSTTAAPMVAALPKADTVAPPPRPEVKAEPAALPRAEAKPRPAPPIEAAAVVMPARVAAPVAAARTAALVAPSPKETTRARPAPPTSTSFAALPPEPPARELPAARKKPAPVAAARVKPAPAQVATASAEAPSRAAPEPEETEVFGLKMPSLAPAGRKLVEGVQALGDAVRDLPGKF